MQRFSLVRAESPADAARLLAEHEDSALVAGGTNLVDLLKLRVVRPSVVVDVSRLGLEEIVEVGGRLRLGAGARNSDVAGHPLVREHYPVIADALLAGASPQLRHLATVGGNLLQRTRCFYFMDATARCNRRDPGSGCDALTGVQRQHAVLGVSDRCIAAHPSDLCVALAALDAEVETTERRLPFADLHLEPGDAPEREFSLGRAEVITAVELPPPPDLRWRYVKVRDRRSFAFALASVAAGLRVEAGRVADVRLALGGVATIPWRARAAEEALRGGEASAKAFAEAADRELEAAEPRRGTAFKVELARRAIVRALVEAAA
jgi:xanthine dehydrogenase YagS FAD-binding subunit